MYKDRLSFTELPVIRQRLLSKELISYASMLYATNLLSQVVHSYVTPLFLLKDDIKKRSVFPEIYGILSTAYRHVCPSIPATLVIYCEQNTNEQEGSWNRNLELESWRKYSADFDSGLVWVKDNLNLLLPYLSDSNFGKSDVTQFISFVDSEHLRIHEEIYKNRFESTRISNF
jgi:hypothetical protein